MMLSRRALAVVLSRLLILSALLAAGCGQAAAPATPAAPAVEPTTVEQDPAEPTVTPEPTATPVPPTATPEPTATATATATVTPAPTLGPADGESFSAWCVEEGVSTQYITDPLTPLDTNRPGAVRDGALEVRNLPAGACVFLYTFNQPAPQGLKLNVYDTLSAEPWLTADLVPVESRPETVAAVLTHAYIVAPPAWDISYTFAVVDSAGSELRRDPVNLHRWEPPLCWNGMKPDLVTLRCPLQQDLHPWDPGYGQPVPTLTPGPEEN